MTFIRLAVAQQCRVYKGLACVKIHSSYFSSVLHLDKLQIKLLEFALNLTDTGSFLHFVMCNICVHFPETGMTFSNDMNRPVSSHRRVFQYFRLKLTASRAAGIFSLELLDGVKYSFFFPQPACLSPLLLQNKYDVQKINIKLTGFKAKVQ